MLGISAIAGLPADRRRALWLDSRVMVWLGAATIILISVTQLSLGHVPRPALLVLIWLVAISGAGFAITLLLAALRLGRRIEY